MPDRSVTLLVAALLLVSAAAPVVALPAAASDTTAATAATANNTTNNTASLGASISAFMQTSAADAEGEVEEGVFTARFRNGSNETRRALVRSRTTDIENRLERLRAERAELLNTTGNLTVGERARAARLTAEIRGLRTAINSTDAAATTAGVNDTRLAQLREEADELDGPEVAEMARGLGGGPPENRGPGTRGPPTDTETDGNETETEDSPDLGDGDRGNANGPPADSPAGNRTAGVPGDTGPPSDDERPGAGEKRPDAGDRGPDTGEERPGNGEDRRSSNGDNGRNDARDTDTPTPTPTPTAIDED